MKSRTKYTIIEVIAWLLLASMFITGLITEFPKQSGINHKKEVYHE